MLLYRETAWHMLSNAAMLLALGVTYEVGYSVPKAFQRFNKWFSGFFIGLIGIAVMLVPFELMPGLVFDTRSILLSVSGMFLGTIPTGMAMLMTAVFRVSQGGVGMRAGVVTILTSGCLGLLWRHYIQKAGLNKKALELYLLGLVTHVTMLLCMLLLPWPMGPTIIQRIGVPVMAVYPVGTVLLGLLLFGQQERRETVRRLSESEERYRSLFYNNHAIMLLIDPDTGQVMDANPAACTHYGWSKEEFRGKKMSEINTLSPEQVQPEMRSALQEKRNHFHFSHRRANGDIFDAEVYSGPIHLEGKALLYSIVHDISERRKAESDLRDSEQRFRSLVEGAPYAIFVQTRGQFAYLNKQACKLYGAESEMQLLNTAVLERIPLEYHERVKNRIEILNNRRKPAPAMEYAHLRLDGSLVEVDVSAVPVDYQGEAGAVVFVRDITESKRMELERKEFEAHLRQQQKLESIGTLASGVAHEINNPLNGVINYAQLILDSRSNLQQTAQYAAEIIGESERIAVIVKNLLQFSRQDKQAHSPAHFRDILEQTLSLVRTTLRRDQIALEVEVPSDLPTLKCRSQQIQQVLMNLLMNARDTLNQKYPGFHESKLIRINCHLFHRESRRWLRVFVEDRGTGIPLELQDKVFEPFFTTKPPGEGTGLGLAISYGLVKDHHGYLFFESEPGEYTRFVLELPFDNGWNV